MRRVPQGTQGLVDEFAVRRHRNSRMSFSVVNKVVKKGSSCLLGLARSLFTLLHIGECYCSSNVATTRYLCLISGSALGLTAPHELDTLEMVDSLRLVAQLS